MRLLNLYFPKKIGVNHLEEFYNYSEIAKNVGMNDKSREFGEGYYVETTRKDGKFTYKGIRLYGEQKWGFISVKDGKVIFQYTEDVAQNYLETCPVITDKKQILLLTEIFWKWYRKLNLPHSIEIMKERLKNQVQAAIVKEIVIDSFDGKYQSVLRVFSDKTTYLVLEEFPPRSKRITKQQVANFDKILADLTGKKVVHDDRELFLIFDDSQEMIDKVVSFLQNI